MENLEVIVIFLQLALIVMEIVNTIRMLNIEKHLRQMKNDLRTQATGIYSILDKHARLARAVEQLQKAVTDPDKPPDICDNCSAKDTTFCRNCQYSREVS